MCRCTNVHVWTGVIDNIRGKKGGGLAQVSIKKIRNERGGVGANVVELINWRIRRVGG